MDLVLGLAAIVTILAGIVAGARWAYRKLRPTPARVQPAANPVTLASSSVTINPEVTVAPVVTINAPAASSHMPRTHLGFGDGVRQHWATTTPYVRGSLVVYLDSIEQPAIEDDPAEGRFSTPWTAQRSEQVSATWRVPAS